MDRSLSSPSTPTTQPLQDRAVPLELIDTPDPSGGRLEPDQETIGHLADAIAQIGLINPVTVRTNGARFTLVAGRRRLAAVKKLGWLTIPVRLLTLSDQGAQRVCAAENMTRSNLSAVEEAILLKPLVDNDVAGIDGVAAALGRSRAWIDSRLELLAWPESLACAVHNKQVSLAAARFLARIPDDALREQRIRDAVNHGINARTASLWLQYAMTPDTQEADPSLFSSPQGFPDLSAKTYVTCVRCQRSLELQHTRPTRICHDCLSELAPTFPKPPQREEIPTPPDLPPPTGNP